MPDPAEWGTVVRHDFVNLFCGELIGRGVARDVYEYAIDDTKVIKVETAAESFQNATEWQVWREVEYTKWARWFAPCHWISPCGIVMIQSRTQPISRAPKEVPNFFSDLKLDNFGKLKGRVVAHDYGLNLLASNALGKVRMKKGSWHG